MNPNPSTSDTLTLTQPDDWHVHLRDGAALQAVVAHTAAQFARALVMPNLKPPITSTALALAYRQRIMAALPEGATFDPLMSLYLTDSLPADEIERAKDAGVVACKLYPAGATTHSDAGVTDLRKISATLEAMQRHGLLLLVHGEVTDPSVDLFDREAVFIERHLIPLRRDFPELKIVMEHITTQEAAQFVAQADGPTAATITAHHLLFNRNALFLGGMRPHYYCLPVLKRETHRLALVKAATSGSARFFLGTDSAPHPAHCLRPCSRSSRSRPSGRPPRCREPSAGQVHAAPRAAAKGRRPSPPPTRAHPDSPVPAPRPWCAPRPRPSAGCPGWGSR